MAKQTHANSIVAASICSGIRAKGVVAVNGQLRPQLSKVLSEVVGEAVVVVDEENMCHRITNIESRISGTGIRLGSVYQLAKHHKYVVQKLFRFGKILGIAQVASQNEKVAQFFP